jgi:hypothetical protein
VVLAKNVKMSDNQANHPSEHAENQEKKDEDESKSKKFVVTKLEAEVEENNVPGKSKNESFFLILTSPFSFLNRSSNVFKGFKIL